MSVQAIIMNEPMDLPASGAVQADGQALDGAEFEELLARATPREDQAESEQRDASAREAEVEAEAEQSAELDAGLAFMGPIDPESPLVESLAQNVELTIRPGESTPEARALQLAASDSGLPIDELQGQLPSLLDSLNRGVRNAMQKLPLSTSSAEAQQQVSAAGEAPPEAAAAPNPGELAARAVSSEAAPELPVAQLQPAQPSARTAPEAVVDAAVSQVSAAAGGASTGSESGAQDAALRDQPRNVETEARPLATSASEFTAALEAREAARPNQTPVQPTVPPVLVETAPGVAPPASALPSAPLTAAGAPHEVLPVHVEWLAARQGGNARITLHPPELGELELMVKVRGNMVDIVIRAHEPAAQLAAVQSRDLLADALTSRNLDIERFDVRGMQTDLGSEDSPAQTNAQAQRDASTRGGGESREGTGESSDSSGLAASAERDADLKLPMPPPVIDSPSAIDLLA